MKITMLALVIALGSVVLAHDEGHGPRLTDASVYGGVVAPVILADHAKLGEKAVLVYKAELLRSEDGTLRVYLYTPKMRPLAASKFAKKAKAVLGTKGKMGWEEQPFDLILSGNAFVGKLPKGRIRKPYMIDVFITEGKTTYLVAFDNLD